MNDCNYKAVRITELFSCEVQYLKKLFSFCEYPWELLPKIKDYANMLISEGVPGFRLIGDGILVAEDVVISDKADITGPVILGKGTVVRPGAYIRGSVITGRNCVIGNSTELKNCIFLDEVQAPHYNYIGDSVLGNKAHTGAGVICSNLKTDKSDIVVHGEADFPTGLRKFGAILADGANIGCGSVLNPGTVVGRNTAVYPLVSLRGVIPADRIVKSADDIIIRKRSEAFPCAE